MKNRIELTIEHKDHSTVELTNGNGDTFTYNPQKHEGLEDFLNGAKILLIADVVGQSEQLSCPKCNSNSIYSTDVEIYHDCNNCGHDWTT